MDLFIATENKGKIAEITHVFEDLSIRLRFLEELRGRWSVDEDEPTFEGNALKKAWRACGLTGVSALADDSGLVVPALGGRPGVRSARYAGERATDEENRQKLLEEMRILGGDHRRASFICVMALVVSKGPQGSEGPSGPGGKEFIVEGRCEGLITGEPRGSGGFGYDPLFVIPALGKTLAELSLAEKNRISHRGQALEKMREVLSNLRISGP